MNVELTKDWCMNMAAHEAAAGDPDCSAGCNGCENCIDDDRRIAALTADNTVQASALQQVGAENEKLRAALARIEQAQTLATAHTLAGLALRGLGA